MKKLDLTSLAVNFTEWFSGIAILNLSWLLFSLPLVTLVPATDTVFEVVNQWKKEGKPREVFTFFRHTFKKNFKQSYRFGLPILIVLLVIVVDIYFLSQLKLTATWFQIFKYAFYTLSLIILLTILYAYPLSKKLRNTSAKIFIASFMLAIGNIKITLAILITIIAFLFFLTWFPAMILFVSMSGLAWIGATAVEYATEDSKSKN